MLPPPEVRFFLAQIARRQRASLNRTRFQLGNREHGRDSYGNFTSYPSRIHPSTHLAQGILGQDHLLDGAQRGVQNPPIP